MRLAAPLLLAAACLAEVPWTMQRLPDTGQTRRYSTNPGDDSMVTIDAPKFAAGAEGVVVDLVTGLEWQKTDGGEMKWDAASAYCQDLKLGGATGWRLPYARELFSIQNHGTINPALDTNVFTRTAAEYWWSAENRVDSNAFAWATNSGGGIGAHPLNETVSAGGSKRYHARCVRGAAVGIGAPEPFADNGDGTVTDNRTGLVWQKVEGAAAISWEEAFAYANSLRLAGRDDWRVPNIKELRSIQDEGALRPTIDARYFPGTAPAIFWSSTTQIGQNGVTAWTLDFNNGVVSYNPKTDRLHLRCVRGGGGPRIAFGGIRNAASLADTGLSPGEIVSLFGSEFGAAEGRSVSIGGTTAPVVAWTDGQVNVIVPGSVSGERAAVRVHWNGDSSPALLAPVAASAPGLFTANASGSGRAAAFNEDGSPNSSGTPARRGSIVVLYATGHGATDPVLADGALVALPAPRLVLPVEVRIGGQPCEIAYAGLVVGLPAGVMQLNVRVPAGIAAGPAEVELRIGAAASQPGVTVDLS